MGCPDGNGCCGSEMASFPFPITNDLSEDANMDVTGTCGFATCKDSEVCCCNATSGQSGYCVAAGSDASVCTGSTMCPDGNGCCGSQLAAFPFPISTDAADEDV